MRPSRDGYSAGEQTEDVDVRMEPTSSRGMTQTLDRDEVPGWCGGM